MDERPRWAGRRGYAVAALGAGAFIVYGSLVPLAFRPVPLAEALRLFARALAGPLVVDSNTDFVTNVLLAIPLAYFTLAALLTDRPGHLRRVAAAIATLALCLALSTLAEFAQVFFQGRTAALSDIVAQCGGAVLGVVAWLLVGATATQWLRDSLDAHSGAAFVERLLLAYGALFALLQVMPLDLTLNLGQLAAKYRRGMILLRPFAYTHASGFDMWWDYLTDVVVNAPLGAAAVLLWTRGQSRRRPAAAWALGTAAVVLIEGAQVFVNSRFADSTDVITGSLGVALGISIATTLAGREVGVSSPDQVTSLSTIAGLATAFWLLMLASYHWQPFNFTTDPVRVTAGVHQLIAVPFYSYYMGSEFHALTEMLRKISMAAPLGALLRLMWSPRPITRAESVLLLSIAFLVLIGIEVGQVFLPTRTPDITDPIMGEVGVLVALSITNRLLMLPGERRHQSRTGTPR